jgi:hypothetical protein
MRSCRLYIHQILSLYIKCNVSDIQWLEYCITSVRKHFQYIIGHYWIAANAFELSYNTTIKCNLEPTVLNRLSHQFETERLFPMAREERRWWSWLVASDDNVLVRVISLLFARWHIHWPFINIELEPRSGLLGWASYARSMSVSNKKVMMWLTWGYFERNERVVLSNYI